MSTHNMFFWRNKTFYFGYSVEAPQAFVTNTQSIDVNEEQEKIISELFKTKYAAVTSPLNSVGTLWNYLDEVILMTVA